MTVVEKYFSKVSERSKFKYRWITFAVFLWMVFDFYIYNRALLYNAYFDNAIKPDSSENFFIWLFATFLSNLIIGVVMFLLLPKIREKKNPLVTRLIKIFLVLLLIIIIIIIRYLTSLLLTNSINFAEILKNGGKYIFSNAYIFDALVSKILITIILQLTYQLGQTTTRGFFLQSIIGKYTNPVEEERIIMFIDLKDSTPISEKFTNKKYFLFIRDFIEQICNAALANGADIYQYVGDEIIVTWQKKNEKKDQCLKTLILSRKNIQSRAMYFQQNYGIVPEFRVGIHVGKVTVGKIGVVKKDLAISGEAMNMTARIRSACSELNQKQLVSEEFFQYTNLKEWQGENLGEIPLKGLERKHVTLYTLKI
jgi:adenylate cyclase